MLLNDVNQYNLLENEDVEKSEAGSKDSAVFRLYFYKSFDADFTKASVKKSIYNKSSSDKNTSFRFTKPI